MIKSQFAKYHAGTLTCHRYAAAGHTNLNSCVAVSAVEAAVATYLTNLSEEHDHKGWIFVRVLMGDGRITIDCDVDDLAWLHGKSSVDAAYDVLRAGIESTNHLSPEDELIAIYDHDGQAEMAHWRSVHGIGQETMNTVQRVSN